MVTLHRQNRKVPMYQIDVAGTVTVELCIFSDCFWYL